MYTTHSVAQMHSKHAKSNAADPVYRVYGLRVSGQNHAALLECPLLFNLLVLVFIWSKKLWVNCMHELEQTVLRLCAGVCVGVYKHTHTHCLFCLIYGIMIYRFRKWLAMDRAAIACRIHLGHSESKRIQTISQGCRQCVTF